jgi:arginine N-succinyltransferase
VGEVGQETRGVQRMLERIGFRYVERIDPFDGGPHYEANVADISLVRRFRTARLAEEDLELEADEMLVGYERDTGRNRFRAVRCQVRLADHTAHLPPDAKKLLDAPVGAKLSLIPFE